MLNIDAVHGIIKRLIVACLLETVEWQPNSRSDTILRVASKPAQQRRI